VEYKFKYVTGYWIFNFHFVLIRSYVLYKTNSIVAKL
jgi:hypothetical protein